jgi:two-component system response regulator GlrR
VRIISATRQELEMAVKRGEFREDLFDRLNVIPLYMPSLAERCEDIPLLIDHFLVMQAIKEGVEPSRFSPEALEYMMLHAWPGNVRQLQNVIEQCSVLSPSPLIPVSLVKQALHESDNKFQTLQKARYEFDAHYLNRVLGMVEGNITYAAHIAGCEREEFECLLAKHNINPLNFDNAHEENTVPDGDGVHLY